MKKKKTTSKFYLYGAIGCIAAIACEAFQKFAPGATPKKVVVVPGRLVNVVL